MMKEIDVFHIDVGRNRQHGRGVVDDALDAGLDEEIAGALGPVDRGGDEPDLDAEFGHRVLQAPGADHFQARHFLTDLEGIAVEGADDVEAAKFEILVAQQRFAEIADADQGAFPDPVDPEGMLDGVDEILDVVADPAYAEFAEVGEVLADLGGVDATGPGQEFRGHHLCPFALEGFQHLDIHGQALDGGLWDVFAFQAGSFGKKRRPGAPASFCIARS